MSLDPITLATITSAVTLLGSEYAKGMASEAGKSTWLAIRSIFSWKSEPGLAEIPEKVAISLSDSPQLAIKIWELLKNNREAGVSGSIVGKIDAEKVIVIDRNFGPIQM